MEALKRMNYVKDFAENKMGNLNPGDLEREAYDMIRLIASDCLDKYEEFIENQGDDYDEGIKERYCEVLSLILVKKVLELIEDTEIVSMLVMDEESSKTLYRPMLEVMAIISVFKKQEEIIIVNGGITVEFIFSAPHVLRADIWVEDYENLLASYEGRETYEIPYVFSIKEIGGAVFSVDLNQVLAINTILEEEKDSFFEMFYEDNDDYGGDY